MKNNRMRLLLTFITAFLMSLTVSIMAQGLDTEGFMYMNRVKDDEIISGYP
jgi:hypothetical protein